MNRTGATMRVSSGTGTPSTRTADPSGACPRDRRSCRTGVPGATDTVTTGPGRRPRATSTSTEIKAGDREALRGRVSGTGRRFPVPFELPRCIRTTRSRIWRLGRARLPQHPTPRRDAPIWQFSGHQAPKPSRKATATSPNSLDASPFPPFGPPPKREPRPRQSLLPRGDPGRPSFSQGASARLIRARKAQPAREAPNSFDEPQARHIVKEMAANTRFQADRVAASIVDVCLRTPPPPPPAA